MPIRAYKDIFTACFELNTILYQELVNISRVFGIKRK